MQQFEQSSSSANFFANACNSEQLILMVQDLGWGGNCVKTQLYCSSRHLICMHWLQIKLQRSILPKATIHGTQPTPARIYCQIYVATHILPNIAASRLKAGAPSSWNILPFSNSYLFSNCKIHLCHHSFCASLPSTSSCFAICRFILSNYFDVKFASFSYHFHWFPLCVPLYYFYKNKASILIHQLNVVCMRFLNIWLSFNKVNILISLL